MFNTFKIAFAMSFVVTLLSVIPAKALMCEKIFENEIRYVPFDGKKAIFHRIERRSFVITIDGKQSEATINHPFDLMEAPVTQILWKKVVELAYIKYPYMFEIYPGPSQFVGETRPVERVTYTDAATWIDALNKMSKEDAPEIYELFQDHKKGATYRLPSELEVISVENDKAYKAVDSGTWWEWTRDAFEMNDGESLTHVILSNQARSNFDPDKSKSNITFRLVREAK